LLATWRIDLITIRSAHANWYLVFFDHCGGRTGSGAGGDGVSNRDMLFSLAHTASSRPGMASRKTWRDARELEGTGTPDTGLLHQTTLIQTSTMAGYRDNYGANFGAACHRQSQVRSE